MTFPSRSLCLSAPAEGLFFAPGTAVPPGVHERSSR